MEEVIPSIDPVTGLVRRSPPAPHPIDPTSIANILDSTLDSKPDHIALIDGERSWSYTELDHQVASVASNMTSAGLSHGDRLVWSTENCAELVIAHLASQRLGLVWVGVRANLTEADRAQLIARVEPVVSVLDIAEATELSHRTSAPEGRVLVDVNDPAAIAFTSGTSGAPKGVVHSQHSMLTPALVSVETDPTTDDERIGTSLPLTVLNALILGPISAFARGSTAIVLRRNWAEAFAVDIVDFGVTRTFVVPTMLHDLLERSSLDSGVFDHVQSIVVGAAGTRLNVRQQFIERFGIRPQLSYGLTEAPTGVVRESLESPVDQSRSYPLPHVEVVWSVAGVLAGSARLLAGPDWHEQALSRRDHAHR